MPRSIRQKLVGCSRMHRSLIVMLSQTCKRPGFCLARHELSQDLQRAVLAFLSLSELALLTVQSRGWRDAVFRALEQLPVVEIDSKEQHDYVLRHCKRLQRIVLRGGELDLQQLTRENAETLRTVEVAAGYTSPSFPFVPECRKLVAVRGFSFDTAETGQLVSCYPALEEVEGTVDLFVLLASKLPLRVLSISGAELSPAHVPLFAVHRRLEAVRLAIASSMPPAGFLMLFRAFERMPALRQLSLRYEGAGNHKEGQAIPLAKPLLLGALRVLRIAPCEEDEEEEEEEDEGPKVPLPPFAAPFLQQLHLSPLAASFSPAAAMARFPSLTAARFGLGFLDSKAQLAAAATGLRSGAWGSLSTLQLNMAELLPFCNELTPLLPRTLRVLSLRCMSVSREAVRSLLFQLPLLEALIVKGSEPYFDDVSPRPSVLCPDSNVTLPRLRALSLSAVQEMDDSRPFGGLLEGISLPALQELSVSNFDGPWDVAWLLLDRYPALETLVVTDCIDAVVELPRKIRRLGKLKKVSFRGCPCVTAASVSPLEARGVNVIRSGCAWEEDSSDSDKYGLFSGDSWHYDRWAHDQC